MFDKRRFKAQIALKGKRLKDIAEVLEIKESTLYRKLKRDGDFTREEINTLIIYLEIERPEEIFFAKELA
ncbi:MAG: XRE family transcriptional regulator [[Eubacterium] sulci]|nr:XRE family transcriptional regulator [[Eubacterium] sulci]